MRKMYFTIVGLLFTAIAFSQGTITGTIVDGDLGDPLPGASVMVKGTTAGVAADFDGNFSIEVSKSSGTLVVSYIGYISKEVAFTSAGNIGTIQLMPNAQELEGVVVISSIAIDRKTPVAVSTIKAADIELKLGTQEFPEILKSTPGVYATKAGGAYGDGRINLRGFESENVAVMINGVPVNDMENGAVYWSNWAGLGDVTSSMQVQRGLGASKVAVPSIGGTVNILTKTTDSEKGGNIILGGANNGYFKYGATVSTGLMDNGFAATVSAAQVSGDGYVQGTEFNGVNYFVNLSKRINDKHTLSFTAFGTKQTHGQHFNRRTIAETRAADAGPQKFNPDWGYYNGQVEYVSYNFYHKPQISLNHYWDINETSFLSTAIYASFGSGGGRREQGDKLGTTDYRLGASDQPIDFDKVAQENKERGSLGSSDILYDSKNAHKWYGLLSTYKKEFTDKLTFLGGVDARYYVGSHWYEVKDLLGGEFYVNPTSQDNNFNEALKVGDRFSKDYDGKVVNAGLFAQAEYQVNDQIATFISTSVSNTTYSTEDYIRYAPTDPKRKSEKPNFVGYSAKGGANYNLDATNNVFANIGYFSKAPFLAGNVFLNDRSTDVNKDALNEDIFSVEVGYGYRSSSFTANVNVYRTSWLNKSLTGSISNPDPAGERINYNVPGLDALHQGIELDFRYMFDEKLSFTGMLSLGDWKWKSNAIGIIRDDSGNQIGDPIEVFAKDLRVTDAAQTTFALGANYKLLEKTAIYIDYNYAADLYAYYNITSISDESSSQNSWELPTFGLLDIGLNHGFNIGEFDTTLTARMNNALNTEYISDANNGNSNTASDATVYYGAGRTFSLGLKIKF